MIFDADASELQTGIDADICIVGAGPAGISIALALLGSGLNVVLLESGGEGNDESTQALYQGVVEDDRMHSPLDRYRMRRYGGSSTVWGGRCMPFDAIDFEHRTYVPLGDWPIDLNDVAPFYPRANALCEAGDFEYKAHTAFGSTMPALIQGFDTPHFSADSLERFSCPTDFGARYRNRLRDAQNVRLVMRANLTRITMDATCKTVQSVEARSLTGAVFSIRARKFVLAVGGLEVVRLLLNHPGSSGRGLGNAHDVVGRYYMCHLAGTIGEVRFADKVKVQHGYSRSDEGVYCRRRLALLPQTQQAQGLSNFVARLHHPRITDPQHRTGILSLLCLARFMVPYEYAKRLYGGRRMSVGLWFHHLYNVLLDLPAVVGFLWHWVRYRTLAARKFPSIVVKPRANRYSIDFHAEQLPNPQSRVSLDARTDQWGVQRLRVDWRYTPRDVESVKAALALLAEDLAGSGVARFSYEPAEVEEEMVRYGAYGGHHIGTARMGTDPATSVVDAHCKLHEVDNLFIAGSAVFPTSSQANPTLTIVALALRLADHLRK